LVRGGGVTKEALRWGLTFLNLPKRLSNGFGRIPELRECEEESRICISTLWQGAPSPNLWGPNRKRGVSIAISHSTHSGGELKPQER